MIIDKSPDLPPLALIAGPTASGKSDLAVKLGQRIEAQGRKAVVINADSAQVYADLRVLSARPGEEEMGEIEHRLFGAWDGADACSAADWATAAKREIAELHAEGAVPILCGGTGLYMRTLLEGIAPVPGIKPAIREQVRALSQADARAALEIEDPEAAARLASADASRTTRALEVIRSTGRTLKDWQASKTGGIGDEIALYPLVLLPEREWLYERCDRRFAMMLEHGAIEEVETLLARNLDPALPVMRAIGVPEIAGLLQGDLSLAQAIVSGQTATRQYAKRQYTWFRNQPPESWARDDNKTIDEYDIFVSLLRRMS
ncbi:MAG: tRNA (adenosine(37)-N6)-dimethylallyltransferase MiaA [Erythrobacter sp.]|nr:tRNA (adenosine(37)-N6)-dimethylallyltransferase MiaA [Erythrobacter sp.]